MKDLSEKRWSQTVKVVIVLLISLAVFYVYQHKLDDAWAGRTAKPVATSEKSPAFVSPTKESDSDSNQSNQKQSPAKQPEKAAPTKPSPGYRYWKNISVYRIA